MKEWLYSMVFSNGENRDAWGFGSFELAKETVMEQYMNWMHEFSFDRQCSSDFKEWTKNEVKEWNAMIEKCYCLVEEYNSVTDEYDDYWYPSEEDLREIGWLPYDELVEAYK